MADEDQTDAGQEEDETEEEEQGEEESSTDGSDESDDDIASLKDDHNRLKALAAHYLPDGVDLDDELDHVVQKRDGSFAYRPPAGKQEAPPPKQEQTEQAPPRKRSRQQRQSAPSSDGNVVGMKTIQEKAAAFKSTVKGGGNALPRTG